MDTSGFNNKDANLLKKLAANNPQLEAKNAGN